MDYKIITKNPTNIVTVPELKAQLMLWGDNSYDAELLNIIDAAANLVEDACGKSLSTESVLYPLDTFKKVQLPHEYIADLTVHYFDVSGDEVLMDASGYVLDETGMKPKVSFKEYKALSPDLSFPISIKYTATPNVPARVKHAVLVTAAELFEVRGETTEKARAKAAITVDRLIGSYKRVAV